MLKLKIAKINQINNIKELRNLLDSPNRFFENTDLTSVIKDREQILIENKEYEDTAHEFAKDILEGLYNKDFLEKNCEFKEIERFISKVEGMNVYFPI